jgi:uncharacterized protein (DUF362 family)
VVADVRARVALTRGDTRKETVSAALAAVEDSIKLEGVRHVLIKPNFVSVERQLAATHVDAIAAVLEMVRRHFDGPVTIGEGPAGLPARMGFEAYGYVDVARRYGADLLDLNADATVPVQVYDRRLRPLTLHLARTAVEADYRIVVGPPKTHDTVVVTLAIKNLVMGALVNPGACRENGRGTRAFAGLVRWLPAWVQASSLADVAKRIIARTPRGSSKLAMHQSIPVINLNLALVASAIWPHLAIIDGWQGMEGSGPSKGDPVDWRIALAGIDALAVDVLSADLMGFDPAHIGYLQHCRELGLGVGDVSHIDVIGGVDPVTVRRPFIPHPGIDRQLEWQMRGTKQRLRACRVL